MRTLMPSLYLLLQGDVDAAAAILQVHLPPLLRGGRRGGKEKKGQTRSKNYLGKEGGSKEEVRRKIPAEHCCSLSGQPCARKAWW